MFELDVNTISDISFFELKSGDIKGDPIILNYSQDDTNYWVFQINEFCTDLLFFCAEGIENLNFVIKGYKNKANTHPPSHLVSFELSELGDKEKLEMADNVLATPTL